MLSPALFRRLVPHGELVGRRDGYSAADDQTAILRKLNRWACEKWDSVVTVFTVLRMVHIVKDPGADGGFGIPEIF
jgi:hypothetical protein